MPKTPYWRDFQGGYSSNRIGFHLPVIRQTLIHKKAVVDISTLLSRKLVVNARVHLQKPVTVSKEKASVFLAWLAPHLVDYRGYWS